MRKLRPLDYDYLMRLPPGPQRFYELLSFQIYGALASGRSRAKMRYSDYCKYAPQVRYFDFDHLKKQMFKIHIPHRESGYITKVEYQETTDSEGKWSRWKAQRRYRETVAGKAKRNEQSRCYRQRAKTREASDPSDPEAVKLSRQRG